MTPTDLYLYIIAASFVGFALGYIVSKDTFTTTFAIGFGIICAAGCGWTLGTTIDNSNTLATAIPSVERLTIVDSFQGTGFLGGDDLTIKLSNGKIIHFWDPYKWKKFHVGDQYNFTRWNTVSMISGPRESYNYIYLGVV